MPRISMEFKDHLKAIGKGLAGLAQEGYKEAQKRTQAAKEEVQRRGGVGPTFEHLADKLADRVEETFSKLSNGADEAFKKGEDAYDAACNRVSNILHTDGVYDPKKAEALLNNAAETTRVYGVKAATTLLELAKFGTDKAKAFLDKSVPSAEDKIRYEGIGTEYRGLLLKTHYESCLAFHEQARKNIPSGVKVRDALLADIKAHAIADREELLKLYISEKPRTTPKVNAVKKYLA